MKHPLATEGGVGFMIGLLMGTGSMCHRCGYATRKTSAHWAKCKRCGLRVPHVPFPKPFPRPKLTGEPQP